MNTRSEIEW